MANNPPSIHVPSRVLSRYRDYLDGLVSASVNKISDEDRTKIYTIPTFATLCNGDNSIYEAYQNSYKFRFPTSGQYGELSEEQVAHQGMAVDTPFFAMNLTTGDFSLYSGNPEHLALFKGGDKFDATKNYEMLKEGIVNAMRLDVKYTNVRGSYDVKSVRLTNAKSGDRRLHIDNFIFVPITIIDRLILMLTTFMRKGRVVKIVSDEYGTLKENFVSVNPKVLKEYNGHGNPLEFIDFRYVGRVYVPVVGAPIYSTGLTRIDVSKLDEVTVTRKIDLDLEPADNSMRNLVEDEIFSKYLEAIFMPQYESTKKDFWDLLILLGSIVPYDANRYGYLRAIRDLEGEARKALWSKLPKNFIQYSEQIGTIFKGYQPYTGSIEHSVLKRLFREGVYKVVMMKADGSFSSMIITNNVGILKKAYGADYQQRLEHDDFRLGKFYKDIQNGMSEVDSMNKWNMLEAAYVKEVYDTEVEDTTGIAYALYEWAKKNEKIFYDDYADNGNPVHEFFDESNEITVRKLFVSTGRGGSFYRKVSLSKIFQISRLG